MCCVLGTDGKFRAGRAKFWIDAIPRIEYSVTQVGYCLEESDKVEYKWENYG